MVDANGGTPEMLFAFPFMAAALFFSAASAFFDFVPFAYEYRKYTIIKKFAEAFHVKRTKGHTET
jgi:hypothetical protein